MKIDYFKLQIEKVQVEKQHLKKRLDGLGTMRVLAFVGALASFIMGNLNAKWSGYVFGGVLLVLFIVLVKRYKKLEDEKNYKEAREKVLESYLARLGDEWKQFEENGESYREDNAKAKRRL